jgi:lysophospholipid acyltransferase (LPLAT)-like uncharacterized protein
MSDLPKAGLRDDELPLPEEAAEAPPPVRQVNEMKSWRYLLLKPVAWVAALVLRAWTATLRFEITEHEQALLSYTEKPVIQVTWHNRLFIVGEIQRRYRPKQRLVALVSASKDGAWLTALFKQLNIDTVRGSSSWRGMQALREMLAARETGADVGITPDGPRGPCYEVKPGVILLARLTHAPILYYSARFHQARRLQSWDRFYLPRPFSTVELSVKLLPDYANLGADGEGAARELRRRILEITDDK